MVHKIRVLLHLPGHLNYIKQFLVPRVGSLDPPQFVVDIPVHIPKLIRPILEKVLLHEFLESNELLPQFGERLPQASSASQNGHFIELSHVRHNLTSGL